jgi:hypothetical protein
MKLINYQINHQSSTLKDLILKVKEDPTKAYNQLPLNKRTLKF